MSLIRSSVLVGLGSVASRVLGFVRAKDFRGRDRDRPGDPRVQPELVGDDVQW